MSQSYASLLSNWPPPLQDHELKDLTSRSTSFALSNALQYLPRGTTSETSANPAQASHAPFTLFPSPFPRKLFEQAQKVQRIYNVLYARVSWDKDFLDKVFNEIGDPDDFCVILWKRWKTAEKNIFQLNTLGIFRSDYLLQETTIDGNKSLSLKQVEFNTIAASFGALSDRIAAMHRYLYESTGYFSASPVLKAENFPLSNTLASIAEGLAAAHKRYNVPDTKILFVVQPNERNIFDQRLLEYELLKTHSIIVVRQTFAELNHSIRLDGLMQNLKLLLDEDRTPSKSIEISVVYYRAGYDSQDYEDSNNYNIRILLEKSLAIKCPSIPLQLAGSKKVQQILTKPGVLESFISDPGRWHTDDDMFEKEDLDLVRATWVSMFALDEDDSQINPGGANDPVGENPTPVETSGVRKARELAPSLVLKPQREGGGHNVFTDDIPAFLDTLPPEKRAAWIAQEMIFPPHGMGNIVMRAEDEIRTPNKIETVNELGIFGWNLHHLVRRMREKEAGWLVRTKNKDVNEGGVAAGFAGLDSLLLVDD